MRTFLYIQIWQNESGLSKIFLILKQEVTFTISPPKLYSFKYTITSSPLFEGCEV